MVLAGAACVFVVATGVTCLVSFGDTGDGLCADDACSGRGACTVVGGEVSCDCDPGYYGDRCESETADGGVPDGETPDAEPIPCTVADDGCLNDVETWCDVGTGQLHTRPCPLGCATNEPRCLRFVPSNVAPGVLTPDASDVTVSTDKTVDTSNCDGPFGDATVIAQIDGPELCVIRTGAFHLVGQVRLTVVGSRPLVLLAAGPLWIEGILIASASTSTAGPGGARGGRPGHVDGEGGFPGRDGADVGEWQDGGGGGGGLCGAGGVGGTGQSAVGGAGGGVVAPTWELSPLVGGSGGGMGHGEYGGGVDNVGRGGAGGGAVQLSSAVSITVDGVVVAGGGGGRGGTNHFPGTYECGAGGGAGSGGARLLEAPGVTLGPGGGLGVSGGGGGGGASNLIPPDFDGPNGGLLSVAGGLSGGTEYGSPGGAGSTATTPSGSQGGSNSNPDANGGGGGGGAGCILIRNADGQVPTTGATNPEVAPGLRALPAHRQ